MAMTFCLSQAQNPDIDALRAMIQKGRVTIDYSFVYEGNVNYSGRITVQDECFKAVGNGFEIYCDGSSRWTVDPEAKEVYIEKSQGQDELLRYLSDVTDLQFKKVRNVAASDNLSLFIPDLSSCGEDWVITDLR